MVDALDRARRWLAPNGVVIDLRPASPVPQIELVLDGGRVMTVGEPIVAEGRHLRHRNADLALRATLERGLFDARDEQRFSFFYYADSPAELRDYLAANWRETRMDDDVFARTVAAVAAHSGGHLRMHEQAGIRTLYPR